MLGHEGGEGVSNDADEIMRFSLLPEDYLDVQDAT
jgi:hypothetical protein